MTFERFPSSDNPLSSDIFLIKGASVNYVFDTGASSEAKEFLDSIPDKVVILSHFHQDHSANAKSITFRCLYGGKKTCDYLKIGTAVQDRIVLEEGLEISPLITCHAKGSLMLNLNHEYLFVGDALCGCALPDGRYGYNAGMLLSTIRELEKEDFENAVESHSGKIIPKSQVLGNLRTLYAKRNGNNPYIAEA